MKRIILTIATAVALLAATGAQAQNVPTSLQGATNVLASGGGLAPVNALLNILPSWDPTATNTFGSGEVTIESAPLWKSQTAAGTTPYNSTEVDYFFTRNIGAGAEVISLGSGTGNSTIDSFNVNLTLRKDSGNIAIYGIAGGGYDLNRSKGQFLIGPGIVYGYQTHIRLFLDTRCQVEGTKKQDIGFLTRLGAQLWF